MTKQTAPAICDRIGCLDPPEFIVGKGKAKQHWCNRHIHYLELTTKEEARPPIREMKPNWSETR